MLAPEFGPSWGGVGTYVSELMCHLPDRFEFVVLTTRRHAVETQEQNDILRTLRKGINVSFISEAKDTFFYNAPFQYACLREVPRLLRNDDIDLIHSHTAHMPDLLLSLRKTKVPILTSLHTTIRIQREATKACGQRFGLLEHSEKVTLEIYPLLRALERVYFLHNREYVTPSHWMKRMMTSELKGRSIRVIPNSIDPSPKVTEPHVVQLMTQCSPNRKVVLFCGRLLAIKGVPTLVRAIPRIIERTKENLLFVFAGPGPATSYSKELELMKVSKEHYIFTGLLPRQEVFWLMKKARVLVMPSFVENCPFALLEAMACGCSVVASRVGGIPDIIKDGYDGLLTEPGNVEEFSETVSKLLAQPQTCAQLGANARRTVQSRFLWSTNSPRYIELYEGLLRR